MKGRDGRLCAAVFACVLLLDLCWRSYFFNFDGVACAIAVDLSDFRHLVHGNHLAYGVLAWVFDRGWRLLGYRGDALWTLQVLDALLGAAGAAVFASLLKRSGRSERTAFLGAAALAVSQAWWFWSLEAQVYMLGALFAALAAREALADKPRPAVAGLWAAAAILGHVGHVMALPALLWILPRRRGALRPFLATVSATVAASYLAAGILAVRPTDLHDLSLWLLGSAALKPDRTFSWHSAAPLDAVWAWSRMTLRVFDEFVGLPGEIGAAGVLLAALPLACAARGAARGGRAARFWLFWLAGYAALYLTWEPFTVVYRVSDLIGLWALAVAGLEGLSPRARTAALAAWAALAGSYNWATQIRPNADPASNPDYAEARSIASLAPEDAWIVVYGRDQVYVPYFAHRRPLNLRYWPDEAALDGRLDELAARGEAVFAADRALEESGRRAEFERYGLDAGTARDGTTLYRVRRAASPTGAGGRN
jgi:hypothetical protein